MSRDATVTPGLKQHLPNFVFFFEIFSNHTSSKNRLYLLANSMDMITCIAVILHYGTKKLNTVGGFYNDPEE